MVKVSCFSLRKQECDWVVPLIITEYRKIVRTLSRGNIALVINTNGWESLGCFGKRGKKRKNLGRLYFFLQNFHLDTFRWILSRITSGFPTKMVRDVRETIFLFRPCWMRKPVCLEVPFVLPWLLHESQWLPRSHPEKRISNRRRCHLLYFRYYHSSLHPTECQCFPGSLFGHGWGYHKDKSAVSILYESFEYSGHHW